MGSGAGVAVGDGDVGVTVGCGVAVWCGDAVRCGDGVADGLGECWCAVRRGCVGVGDGCGAGEEVCCVPGLSPVVLALGDGGETQAYSTSVPRKMAMSTQVEVRSRPISRSR